MFAAYADESGQDDAGIFVLAGYVFDPRSGDKFEKSWSKTLNKYHVSELHMKDLTRFKGDFKGWSENQRAGFLDKLITPIHARSEFHVVVAVDTHALKIIEPDDNDVMIHMKIYSVASAHFMGEISRLIDPSEPIAFLFDCVPNGQGKDRVEWEFYDQRRKGTFHPRSSIGWFDSKDYEGIQAADFLAYESAREYSRVLDRADYPFRFSGSRLVQGMGSDRRHEAFVDREWIDEFIAAAKRDPDGVATIEMLTRWNRRERKRHQSESSGRS